MTGEEAGSELDQEVRNQSASPHLSSLSGVLKLVVSHFNNAEMFCVPTWDVAVLSGKLPCALTGWRVWVVHSGQSRGDRARGGSQLHPQHPLTVVLG